LRRNTIRRRGRRLRLNIARFLVVRIRPALLRRSLGYIQMPLPYYCRGRERDVRDGKDKKDSSEYLVLMHFRELELDDVVS
jgi:hypothetical protein